MAMLLLMIILLSPRSLGRTFRRSRRYAPVGSRKGVNRRDRPAFTTATSSPVIRRGLVRRV